MKPTVTRSDRFGLARPAVDAHTLGLSSVRQLLEDCGIPCVTAEAGVCEAFGRPEGPENVARIERWIRENRLGLLGFSYRHDPQEGATVFGRLLHELKRRRLLADQGGPLKAVYFAGLPKTCRIVKAKHPETAGVFQGDETPAETLGILGLPATLLPRTPAEGLAYDEARLAFGRDLVRRAGHLAVKPVDRSGYDGFGTEADTVVARLAHGAARGLPPLVRAHVGPYLPDRGEAVRLFLEWARSLAAAGLLDVLSIGTSQRTQSNFGEESPGTPCRCGGSVGSTGGVPTPSGKTWSSTLRPFGMWPERESPSSRTSRTTLPSAAPTM